MALKDTYWTISEAAKEFGVTRQTISRWITDGKISGEKIGRETLIKKDDLYEYQKERLTYAAARQINLLMLTAYTDYCQENGYISAVERIKEITPCAGYGEFNVEKFDGTSRILKLQAEQLKGISRFTMPRLEAFLKDFGLSMRDTFKQYEVKTDLRKNNKGGKTTK